MNHPAQFGWTTVCRESVDNGCSIARTIDGFHENSSRSSGKFWSLKPNLSNLETRGANWKVICESISNLHENTGANYTPELCVNLIVVELRLARILDSFSSKTILFELLFLKTWIFALWFLWEAIALNILWFCSCCSPGFVAACNAKLINRCKNFKSKRDWEVGDQ